MSALEDQLDFYPDPKGMTNADYKKLAQQIVGSGASNSAKSTGNSINEQYKVMAQYALGTIPFDKYKTQLLTTASKSAIIQNNNAPYIPINWIDRVIKTTISRLLAVQMEPVVLPIDKEFDLQRDSFKAMVSLLAKEKELIANYQDQLKEMGLSEDDLPLDDIELNITVKANFKWDFSIHMYHEINRQLQYAGYESKRELFIMHQIIFGMSAMFDYVDQDDRYHIEVVDPIDVIVGSSIDDYFTDINSVACVVRMTIAQIAIEGQMPLEMLDKLASARNVSLSADFRNQYSQGNNRLNWPGNLQNNQIEVFRVKKLILHSNQYTVKPDNHGGTQDRYIKEKPNYKPSEEKKAPVVKRYYALWHECNYVREFDYVYNERVMPNQFVDPLKPTMPGKPFHLAKGMTINGSNRSLVELMIPFQDMANLCDIQMMNCISKYIPPGMMWDLDQIKKVAIDDEPIAVKELIDTYRATGDIVFSGYNEVNNNLQAMGLNNTRNLPAQVAPRPDFISEIQLWLQLQLAAVQAMVQIGASNDAALGSNPNPEVGKAQTIMALQGSDNAIGFLFRIQNNIFSSLCANIVRNKQCQLATGDETMQKHSKRELQVSVINGATKEQKMQIMQIANVAVQQGSISLTDVIKLQQIDNLSEMHAYFMKATRKNRMMAQQAAQENQKMQTELQTQQAQQVEQMRQQTQQAAMQNSMATIQAKSEAAIRELQVSGDIKMEIVRLQAEMQSSINESSSDVSSNNAMAVNEHQRSMDHNMPDPAMMQQQSQFNQSQAAKRQPQEDITAYNESTGQV